MNYTENYHLPQWDETDRIMRTDFNQMCTDIEEGLNGGIRAADMVQQSSDAQNQRTLDRVCRLAYNHYHLVKGMNAMSSQIGIFFQNPIKDRTGISRVYQWANACFAGSDGERITAAQLLNYIQVQSQLSVVKGNLGNSTPLVLTLCAPTCCQLTRFSLQGSFSNNTPNNPAPFRLTLTNLDTGLVEQVMDKDMAMIGYNGVLVNHMVDGVFYFHGGVHYRLELTPLAAVYDMSVNFALNEQTLLTQAINPDVFTATHSFHETMTSEGGMLMLRCRQAGPDGVLTVKWDGKELPVHSSWMERNSDGLLVSNQIYIHTDPVPADSTVTLQFECGEQGSFLFYDWGGILL